MTNTMVRRSFLGAAFSVVAIGIAGCASPPPPPPPPPPPTLVNLTIQALPNVNPGPTGQGSPVQVRIYQLAADGTFKASDFFQLYNKEDAVLKTDMVSNETLTVLPGSTQTKTLSIKADTKLLAAVAQFRAIDTATWRADVAIPPNKTTPVTLKLDGQTLSLTAGG